MADILLTSEARVKEYLDISDNVNGKVINVAIRTAQSRYFETIVGETLYDKLCDLVHTGAITQEANAKYKALLDKAQPLLCWRAAVELLNILPLKVGNVGVVKASDENLQPASQTEIIGKQNYYESEADFCLKKLQGWILEHHADYPELSQNDCNRIQSNLYSAASCGIWLGGARGKQIRKPRCRRGYDR